MSSYRLSLAPAVSLHDLFGTRLLRDQEDSQYYPLWLEARIRSGDYFVSLATLLDTIANNSDATTARRLESLINELLLLQGRYTITKNDVIAEDTNAPE